MAKGLGGHLVPAESGNVDRGSFLFGISVWLRQSGAHRSDQGRCHSRGHSLCPALVGLDADEKKKFRAYSLGMKQRLGIAAAIMEKPKLLVLDEPTNALDEAGVGMLKRVVAMAASTGREVIRPAMTERCSRSGRSGLLHARRCRCESSGKVVSAMKKALWTRMNCVPNLGRPK